MLTGTPPLLVKGSGEPFVRSERCRQSLWHCDC